jgi:hypothetical protein
MSTLTVSRVIFLGERKRSTQSKSEFREAHGPLLRGVLTRTIEYVKADDMINSICACTNLVQ